MRKLCDLKRLCYSYCRKFLLRRHCDLHNMSQKTGRLGGNGNESVPSIDPCWESQTLGGHTLARLTETDLFLLPHYTRHTRISLFSFFAFFPSSFVSFSAKTQHLSILADTLPHFMSINEQFDTNKKDNQYCLVYIKGELCRFSAVLLNLLPALCICVWWSQRESNQ